MTEAIRINLWEPQQAYQAIKSSVWPHIKSALMAGQRLVLIVKQDTRTLAQNRLMWSCLEDLSSQVLWFGKKMTAKAWKDWITGHIEGQELVPNMDKTGFISIGKGKSTSDMTISEMTAVIDLCHAFGAAECVEWRPTSIAESKETA